MGWISVFSITVCLQRHEIYQRTTSDMIGPAEAIPMMSGISSGDRAKVNNASLRTRGWELSVNWNDRLKCGFSYGYWL